MLCAIVSWRMATGIGISIISSRVVSLYWHTCRGCTLTMSTYQIRCSQTHGRLDYYNIDTTVQVEQCFMADMQFEFHSHSI